MNKDAPPVLYEANPNFISDAAYLVELFGGLRVFRRFDRTPMATPLLGDKLLSLFAYLACTGQPAPRALLIDRFWPEADDESGSNSYYQAVHQIRRQFATPTFPRKAVLETTHKTVALSPKMPTDVGRFWWLVRAARQAAHTAPDQATALYRKAQVLYGSGLLPGWYEDWVLLEQRQVELAHEEIRDWLGDGSFSVSLPPRTLPTKKHRAANNAEEPLRFADYWAYTPVLVEFTQPLQAPPLFQNATAFFGRDAELSTVLALCRRDGPGLVTLIGMGGIGKTRLAQQALKTLADDSAPGRCTFADVTLAASVEHMSAAIVAALGKPVAQSAAANQEQILQTLRGVSNPVLLLDNADRVAHLGPETGAWLQQLALRAGNLTVLVTSRVVLDVDLEQVVEVTPLAVPFVEEAERCRNNDDTEALIALYPSLQLYRNRARSVAFRLNVGPETVRDVVELLRAVEGIPLAIELAAARAKSISPKTMAFCINGRRYATLEHTGGRFEERHRCLRATIGFSVNALGDVFKDAFYKLAVCAGSFSLEAAHAVLFPGVPFGTGTALNQVEALANHSLLICEEARHAPTGHVQVRYRMLDTIRDYAHEEATAETRETGARLHARFFSAFSTEHKADLFLPEQEKWMAAYRTEYPNLRAAVSWLLEQETEHEVALTMCAELARYWMVRGPLPEGRAFLKRALQQGRKTVPAERYAVGLNQAGTLANEAGDTAEAYRCLRQYVWLTRPGGSVEGHRGRGIGLLNLAMAQARRGQFTHAKATTHRAIAFLGNAENGRQALAAAWGNLGHYAMDTGDWDEADTALAISLQIAREVQDARSEGLALASQAELLLERGNPVAAEALYRQSLVPLSVLGDEWLCALSVLGVAACAQETGKDELATWLGAVAVAAAVRMGRSFPPRSERRRRLLPAYQAAVPLNFAQTISHLTEAVVPVPIPL